LPDTLIAYSLTHTIAAHVPVFIKLGTGGNGIPFEWVERMCSASASIFTRRTQRLRSRQLRQRFHDGPGRSIYSIVASARGSDADETDTRETGARADAAHEADTRARARAAAGAGSKTGLSI
jgi:hypothetical protein